MLKFSTLFNLSLLVITLLITNNVSANRDPYSQMLPVHTPQMTPGKVKTRTLSQAHMSRPMFIVGDDPLSYRWLKARRSQLLRLNAIGIVVNVDDIAGLNRLRQFNLTLYPVNGSDFAKSFSLKHYPVLITAKQLRQ